MQEIKVDIMLHCVDGSPQIPHCLIVSEQLTTGSSMSCFMLVQIVRGKNVMQCLNNMQCLNILFVELSSDLFL